MRAVVTKDFEGFLKIERLKLIFGACLLMMSREILILIYIRINFVEFDCGFLIS
jgi:hypothetical protein